MTREEFLSAWVRIGGPPNVGQLEIMDYAHGPLQIIAGPGVGKTYALILRVLFLLCVRQVEPSAIVLTTFTRKAAGELRQRLQEKHSRLSTEFPDLRAIDLSQMRLGTLHSLCWDILTETPKSRYRHLHRLGALEQAFFIYRTSSFGENNQDELHRQLASWIDKKNYRTPPSRWQWVKTFTKAYERLHHDRIDRARFAGAKPIYGELLRLVEEYEAALEKRDFTDNTLMQQQALDLLCEPAGNFWRQGIQYVIVDEYQDTNPLQAALYRALADAPPYNLGVVGDDDQALYRFRGGTVGCLVHFAEECQHAWPGCSVCQLPLVENYRSQRAILDWCNDLISIHPQMLLPNARIAGKAPLSAQSSFPPTNPAVLAIRGKDLSESADNFVTTLRLLKEQGVIESYDQCALLARSLKGMAAKAYINELQQQSIPTSGLTSYKEQQVYMQILGTLFLALDHSKNLLPGNFAADNATYVDECRQAAQDRPVLVEAARQINTWLLTQEKAASTMSLTKLAQRILNLEPCITAIEQDQELESAAHMLIETLDAYDRIVNLGYSIPLQEVPGIAGKKRVAAWWMQRLYRILVEGIQQEYLERGEERMPRLQTSALSLLTIHSAKGLEFPVVAVVVDKQNRVSPKTEHQLERDVFPFRLDLTEEQAATPDLLLGGNDEERAIQDLVRLHYVAYSRAQMLLLLLIVDEHLKNSPPALGLGTDAAWFRQRVEVWPPRPQKTRKAKSGESRSQEGVEQHGFEW